MQPFQDVQVAVPGGQDHGVRAAALSICGKTKKINHGQEGGRERLYVLPAPPRSPIERGAK